MSEQSETFSDVVAERDAMVGFFRYLDGEVPGVLEDLEAIRGEGATAGQYEALAARVLDWARDDEQQELVQERDDLQARFQQLEAQAAAMREVLEEEKLCHACGGTGKQHRHDSLYDRSEWTCGACAGSGLRSHIAETLAGDAGRALLAERDGLLTTIASREEEIERLRQAMQAAADESHAAITYEQGLRDRQRERAETAERERDQWQAGQVPERQQAEQAVVKAALERHAAMRAWNVVARFSLDLTTDERQKLQAVAGANERFTAVVAALAALEKEAFDEYMQREGWKYLGSASDDA